MVKRLALAMLLAGAFYAPPAQAGIYLSGNDLYADCSVPKDNPVYYSRTERCTGFVSGVVDATEGLRSLLGLPYCVPENVTLGQLNDVVRGYLNSHASERTLAASALVLAALTTTYGCDSISGK
jgi:hypothetical protein